MKWVSYLLLLVVLSCSFFPTLGLAQATSPEADESFDPFSDYNEFEQEADEEADINFLKNGRYLTLAMLGGIRGFTGGFSEAYAPSAAFGVQFSYFFDLNLAGTLSYTTGDHGVEFRSFNDASLTSQSNIYTGSINLQSFDLQVKYYFNTDNVTKGLADLNPYLLAGTAYVTRTYNLDKSFGNDPDQVFGFRMGAGIEIPIARRRFYVGAQALYTYVQFPDENKGFIDEGTSGTVDPKPIKPKLDGDTYEVDLILGTNF